MTDIGNPARLARGGAYGARGALGGNGERGARCGDGELGELGARCGDGELDAERALSRAGRGAALSYESAARAHGLDLLDTGPDRLTVPRNRSRLRVPGWQVVRSNLLAGEVEEREGVRVTSVERTARDLARVLPLVAALVTVHSALRQLLLTAEDLGAGLGRAHGRGATRLRAVAAAADPLSGSVLETVLRLLLQNAGLRPVTQHCIRDGHGVFVARVDFCRPELRLVVEADGFAFHSDRAAYHRDRQRLNELERLGWRVLRFTYEDVLSRPEHVLATVRDCLRVR